MLMGDMKYNFERLVKRGKVPNLQSIIRSQLLTSRLRSALATGEWVGDINEGYYIHSDEDGTYRVIRGGSFSNSAEGCQIGHIIKSSSSGRTNNVGFRLLMDM